MEPRRPDDPPMEVLDDERPPGFLERRVGPLLVRRGARTGVAVGGAVVLLGVWAATSPDDPREAQDAEQVAAVDSSAMSPPSARERERGIEPWKVRGEVSARNGPRGNAFTFVAVNRGTQPADPGDLQVEAAYVDRPDVVYTVACEAIRRTARGARPLIGPVDPGGKVFMRCVDAPGKPRAPRIAGLVATVTKLPCESSDRMPGV